MQTGSLSRSVMTESGNGNIPVTDGSLLGESAQTSGLARVGPVPRTIADT